MFTPYQVGNHDVAGVDTAVPVLARHRFESPTIDRTKTRLGTIYLDSARAKNPRRKPMALAN